MIYILTHKETKDLRRLAKALDAGLLLSDDFQFYKFEPEDRFINWGCSDLFEIEYVDGHIINLPLAVENCISKIKTLTILSEDKVPCVDWTTEEEQAWTWIKTGSPVYSRTLIRARKGFGIVICKDDLVPARLYTKLFPKTHEYRVHVFNGEVIDTAQKKKMGKIKLAARGLANPDLAVRNLARGWVFSHKNRKTHPSIRKIAIDAAKALGIDFCGIDIGAIWEGKKLIDCRVFEVNTAPSISAPETFEAYRRAFDKVK